MGRSWAPRAARSWRGSDQDHEPGPTTIPFLAGKLHRWLPQLDWPAPTKPAPASSPTEAAELGERRLEAARREAHRLKGAARTVGARGIAELAAEIESGCADGLTGWGRYGELLGRLETALESVADAVHA
jgi:Hpt domain